MNNVTYLQIAPSRWKVFMFGRDLGEMIKGSESVYFRTPSGRGKLFSTIQAVEQKVEQAATRVLARVTSDKSR